MRTALILAYTGLGSWLWFTIAFAQCQDGKREIVERPKATLRSTIYASKDYPIECLGFDQNSDSLFWSQGDNKIRMWNKKSGQRVFVPSESKFKITLVSVAGDCNVLASGGINNLTAWDLATQKPTPIDRKGVLACMAISNKANYIAFSNRDEYTLAIWDLKSAKQKHYLSWPPSMNDPNPIRVLSFSQDESLLATGHELGSVRLWNVCSGKLIATLKGTNVAITALAFSQTMDKLIYGDFNSNITIWDIGKSRAIMTIKQNTDSFAIAVTEKGGFIGSGNRNGTVSLYNLRTGEKVLSNDAHRGYVTSLIFNETGKVMYTSSADGSIKIWDLK